MKKSNHILWIDCAKAIGIFLVVLGHLWYKNKYPIINQYIYSFHIPLFFILSGFVFNYNKKIKFKEYTKLKFFRILLPTIIFLLLGVIKLYLSGIHSLKKLFILFIFYKGQCPFNDPCWFFIVLFEVYIIIYYVRKYFNKLIFNILFILISFIGGYIIYHYKIFIPFGLDRMVIALGFFSLGIIFKKVYNYLVNKNNKSYIYCIWIISAMIWIILSYMNGKVSFYKLYLNSYWYFIITGVTGTITLSGICYYLSKYSIFKRISSWSNNSVFLIGTHYFIIYYFIQLAGHYHLWYSNRYVLLTLLFGLFIVIIYQPICKFLDKKVPFITGKIN
jgi:fucose 4-O-acetylase-like acetyltransferase